MSTETDLGEETQPGVCRCGACVQRARLVEALDADFRITSFFARKCTEHPWTVMVALDGSVAAVGHGDTEEAALYAALKDLGVVA